MKKAIVLVSLLAIAFVFTIFNLQSPKESELLLEVFTKSDFKPIQSNINTYSILDEPLDNLDDMKKYIKRVDSLLGTDFEYEHSIEETDTFRLITEVHVSENARLSIKLKSLITEPKSNYLMVDVNLFNGCENIMTIKDKLQDTFNVLKLTPKINISLAGTYQGELSDKEKKETANSLMKNLGATIQNDYEDNNVFSVVGYTKKINEYIFSNEQKININLALRYNEYEDKTYLYMATPIISTEY